MMNYSFSFFNIYLMYISNRDPNCPHMLYNEDKGALCCQNDIISLHNSQRRILTSWDTPKFFPAMKWDDVLANKAQIVAGKCNFKYEPIEDSRFQTEHNMYIKCSDSDDIKPNWTQVIQDWFSEDKVRPNYAMSFSETGQLAWKKLYTTWVGCGYGNYKINITEFSVEKRTEIHISDSGKEFCQVYVCVYGPI